MPWKLEFLRERLKRAAVFMAGYFRGFMCVLVGSNTFYWLVCFQFELCNFLVKIKIVLDVQSTIHFEYKARKVILNLLFSKNKSHRDSVLLSENISVFHK